MFAEFKEDVEQTTEASEAEDPDTHYNLGVAFKEMGLLDEAIALHPLLNAFLGQRPGDHSTRADALDRLREILASERDSSGVMFHVRVAADLSRAGVAFHVHLRPRRRR